MHLISSLRNILNCNPADLVNPNMQPNAVNHKLSIAKKILSEAELFAFEPSALAVAADLKIHDPLELFRVLQSVLRRPRTVFVEAKDAHRQEQLQHLRNTIFRPLAANEDRPDRVGLLIHVNEPGLAFYRSIWSYPSNRAEVFKVAEFFTSSKKRTKLQKTALHDFLRIIPNWASGVIDVRNSPQFMTRTQFDFAISNNFHSEHQAVYPYYQNAAAGFDRVLNCEERLKIAYWSYGNQIIEKNLRFDESDILYMEANDDYSKAQKMAMKNSASQNNDGELTHIAAMLSVLECQSDDTVRLTVRPARKQRNKNPKSPYQTYSDKLTIVSAPTAGKLVSANKSMSGNSSYYKKATIGGQCFVRGHLFLARNGKMTYRKGHWRRH
jgi:hypothetical protein